MEDKNLSQGHGNAVPRTEPEFWDYFTRILTNRMNQVSFTEKTDAAIMVGEEGTGSGET